MSTQSIEQIRNKIKGMGTMRQLDQLAFAEENGLADSLVQHFMSGRGDLKANQLRKVFGAIKLIQRQLEPEIRKDEKVKDKAFDRTTIAPLLVNLAYARGRKLIPEEFYSILADCLSQPKLQTNEDFIRVAQFTEAILAYYKFRGG